MDFSATPYFFLFSMFSLPLCTFFLQFPFKPPSKIRPKASGFLPPALRAGFLRGVINIFYQTWYNASKQSYWLDICFEFLVRKKAIKFWQILKNANVGPNVDISVTADRRLRGGQNQEGNFNIHVREIEKWHIGTVLLQSVLG